MKLFIYITNESQYDELSYIQIMCSESKDLPYNQKNIYQPVPMSAGDLAWTGVVIIPYWPFCLANGGNASSNNS